MGLLPEADHPPSSRIALHLGSVLPFSQVGSHFPETQWSVVVRAGAGQHEALRELCEVYWYPLYAFARRSGHSEQDALDLGGRKILRRRVRHPSANPPVTRG